MRNDEMKVVAIGSTEALVGFMLAGVKERLETDKPDEALKYLDELAETEKSCMIIISSDIFREIRSEITGLQERRRLFIFYEITG
ncbi:MAG TPA: V-type ATP synthase subunit F, partial [Patescibacteria group bacterium]|nr:V-type ATP synthase subunit F [Patescibacteria group bacterium]